MFAQAIGSAAVILGVYLLLVHFILDKDKVKGQQSYHIGCFHTDRTPNYQFQITNALNKINKQLTDSVKVNMHNSIGMKSDYETKSMTLAQNFEKYIEAIMIRKSKQKNQYQLSQSIKRVSKQYKECNNKYSFDQIDCRNNWNQYQKCDKKLTEIKDQENLLINSKKDIIQKIQGLLKFNYTTDYKKNQADQIQQRYLRAKKIIDQKQSKIQLELGHIRQLKERKQYSLSSTKFDLKHNQDSYQDCTAHRLDYKNCEELSKQIHNLGFDSIEALNSRIIQKTNTLTKLKDMLDRSNSPGFNSIKQLYIKGVQQQKDMIKLLIQTKFKITKFCGCTEDQVSELATKIKQIRLNLKRIQEQFEAAQLSQNTLVQELGSLQRQEDELNEKRIQQLNNLEKTQPKTLDLDATLAGYKAQLQKVNSQILSIGTKFKNLQFLCNQLKDNLVKRLDDIDNAYSCLFTKGYYQKIKNIHNKDIVKFESETQKNLKKVLKQLLMSYEL